MLRPVRRCSLALACAMLVLLTAAPAARAGGGGVPFEVWHTPPGLIVHGEHVVIHVNAQTTDGQDPTGSVFIRSGGSGPFTRFSLQWPDGVRQVPPSFLDGNVLEEYVVVHDQATDAYRRVPATGQFRSWIRDSFPVVDLGRHRFGHVRAPDSIVARASIGDGPNEVGWDCPPEGLCEYPRSFDVGPAGEVWMLDPVHHRMVRWAPGHPGSPNRQIHLGFGMADVAIGPGGTIYVSGVKLGDPVHRMRLYAFAPNGELRWHSHLLTDLFNAHIRFGGDGRLYAYDPLNEWVPATGFDGKPLSIAQQRRGAVADHPVADDIAFVVRTKSGHELRVGLAKAGLLRRAWRITSESPLSDGGDHGTPDVVDGDPVLGLGVYDFQRHVMEYLVLRLSKTDGVVRRFSLGPGVEGGAEVTTLRVGAYDGAMYQLQGSPEDGFVCVARYSLG